MNGRLNYTSPAKAWTEALPLGNGRLGAMVFGGARDEQLQLNEETLYYGAPDDKINRDAAKYLPEIRSLVLSGRPVEAESLARAAMSSTRRYWPPYQPLCDLVLRMTCHSAAVSDYSRSLELETAEARVSYVSGGARYVRELIASRPHGVIALRMTCSRPGGLSFDAFLMRRPYDPGSTAYCDGTAVMTGTMGEGGLNYACVLRAALSGGSLKVIGNTLRVEGADSAVLYIAAHSSYNTVNPRAAASNETYDAAKAGFDAVRAAHRADYSALYSRCSIRLGDDSELPTAERLARSVSGDDPGMAELYFNYGRYLLISCSRPGCLPANLQGIWNAEYTPMCESLFTTNINLQMNYWPAEVCGLSECHEPLFDFTEMLASGGGKQTAREMYGCGGFVLHHFSTIWGDCAMWSRGSFTWPFGAAWLALHFFEHYLYTLDEDFLRERAFPVIRAAAEFFADYLVKDAGGRYVTGLSVSPENAYYTPGGEVAKICPTCAMDNEILADLLDDYFRTLEILGESDGLEARLREIRGALPPLSVGSRGQLLEYDREYAEPEPGHRHISHLFALYPSARITPEDTPALAAAARRSLEIRLQNGGGHTGWSRSWITAYYARLCDGDAAFDSICELFRTSTYPNLLDDHPPFQIDGNFGTAAAIAEMLMQSHGGLIRLLPALPERWSDGEADGLCARGGIRVGMRWRGGRLESASLCVSRAGEVRIASPRGDILSLTGPDGATDFVTDGETVSFLARPGSYTLNCG